MKVYIRNDKIYLPMERMVEVVGIDDGTYMLPTYCTKKEADFSGELFSWEIILSPLGAKWRISPKIKWCDIFFTPVELKLSSDLFTNKNRVKELDKELERLDKLTAEKLVEWTQEKLQTRINNITKEINEIKEIFNLAKKLKLQADIILKPLMIEAATLINKLATEILKIK